MIVLANDFSAKAAFRLDGLRALAGFAVTVLLVGGRLRLRRPAPAIAD